MIGSVEEKAQYKEDMLPYVIVFIILFTVVYLVYNFIFDDMLKKEKYAKISELGFLVRVNNLDKKKNLLYDFLLIFPKNII